MEYMTVYQKQFGSNLRPYGQSCKYSGVYDVFQEPVVVLSRNLEHQSDLDHIAGRSTWHNMECIMDITEDAVWVYVNVIARMMDAERSPNDVLRRHFFDVGSSGPSQHDTASWHRLLVVMFIST
jgi:hypothetical protein